MFRVVYKRNVYQQIRAIDFTAPSLLIHLYSSLLQQKPSSCAKTQNPDPSFTISYLINSCGLSPQSALSVSQKIRLRSSQKPYAVLKLLRNYGFSDTHITEIITKRPLLLLADVNNNLKPKLDFFQQLGVARPTFTWMLSVEPGLLCHSLKNWILPNVDFLKSFIHTDENVAIALRQCARLLCYRLNEVMSPNISILQDNGVAKSMISKMIISEARPLRVNVDRFRETVKLVKDMGFNPSKIYFILAISVMLRVSRSKWEKKVAVYKSLGWSESQFLSAFKLQPMCMRTSEEKIRRVADFLLSLMDLNPSFLSKYPYVFLLSLEKRIIPRCSVLQIIMSKGLIRKDLCIYTPLKISEKEFLERFVIRYEESVPGIQMVYRAKMGIQRLEYGSKEGSWGAEA